MTVRSRSDRGTPGGQAPRRRPEYSRGVGGNERKEPRSGSRFIPIDARPLGTGIPGMAGRSAVACLQSTV